MGPAPPRAWLTMGCGLGSHGGAAVSAGFAQDLTWLRRECNILVGGNDAGLLGAVPRCVERVMPCGGCLHLVADGSVLLAWVLRRGSACLEVT